MAPPIRSCCSLGSMALALLLLSSGKTWAWTHHSSRPTSLSSVIRSRPHNDVRGSHYHHHHHHHHHQHQQQPLRPRHASATSRAHPLSTTSTAEVSNEQPSSSLLPLIEEDIDESTLPLLRIGNRVGSGSYGTVHQGYIIRAKDDIQPCIAKRAWTLAELSSSVPSLVLKLEEEEKRREENLAIAQRTGLAFVVQAARTEIVEEEGSASNGNNNDDDDTPEDSLSPSELKTRSERCRHYWEVEKHCFQKMEDNTTAEQNNNNNRATPAFLGVYRDDNKSGRQQQLGNGDTVPGYGLMGKEETNNDNGWFSDSKDGSKGHQWMVFEFVGSEIDMSSFSTTGTVGDPAQTLLDAMEMDWKDQHLQSGKDNHHLYDIQKALDLPATYTFGESLDAIFLSLLENLKEIHASNIVHRDLKPGNLLCDGSNQRLRLIDFGSAADLDPSPATTGIGNLLGGTQRVGFDEGIVAISPVYSAPETFVKLNDNPLSFDVFSAGLVMCQLLFNLLDERTDAGFLRQLKGVNYDLDAWLEKELAAKLRVAGFENGIEYLGERRGLWGLLKRMFEKDPIRRITSSEALERLHKIIGLRNGEIEWSDSIIVEVAREESYFETVVESFENCQVNLAEELLQNMPRPLHFLASFEKGNPVGLMLAEASEVENDDGMSSDDWEKWQRATQRALRGEVFVRGTEDGGQADQLGIFEIGDRLRGVGELPFVDGGFEQAINLINRQPDKTGFLKLHFDRISTPKPSPRSDQINTRCIRVIDQGTWKSGGRRGNQEDSFALHEIKNNKMGDVLLAGVFDGHAGTAASDTVSRILPSLFTTELLAPSTEADGPSIRAALENSWETTCDTYRNGCDENGECVADYDPIEGILFAETGSKDLFVAGTTATIAAIPMNPGDTNEMTILNCGDSRTLLVGEPTLPDANSFVVFETRDHSPDDEIEIQRLEVGKAVGLDYSIPMCSMAGSYMVVGDYQYALARSLEGSYVTSKGIVSDPDVTTLDLASSFVDRQYPSVVLACDGVFEVMDNEEVGREVVRMRAEGYKAGDVAKNLCGQALKKGSYDNLSVVVVYLDE